MSYNYFLENVLLPLGDLLYGSSYIAKLKIVRKELALPIDELKILQKRRLIDILSYSQQNSIYYSKILSGIQFDDPYKVLESMPMLSKEVLRYNAIELLTTSSKKLTKLSSSGSTGIQTDVYLDKDELSFDRAIQTHWWEWAGYRLGMPMLQTGLSTKRTFEKRLKDYFFNVHYAFAFGFDTVNTVPVFDFILKQKPFLGGYASSLYILSCLLKDKGLNCSSSVSWGDKLFNHYKTSIRNSFNCKVFETYGTGEGFKIAAQKDLDYMYIMSPYVYLEIVDDDGHPVQDGVLGNVVVTSLINKSMPLIRYRIGDLAIRLPKKEYPDKCDLTLPILKMVVGRETDIIVTPSGKKLIVHSFTGIFEYYPSIYQFCIVQENLSGIRVLYIPDSNFILSVLDEINSQLVKLIEEPFAIEFESVDYIPPTPSGKPQIVISRLKQK